MQLPSVEAVNDKRVAKFLGRITDTLQAEGNELDLYRDVVLRYQREHDMPVADIAAALAKMVQGRTPLLLSPEKPKPERTERFDRGERTERGHADRGARPSFDRGDRPQFERAERPARAKRFMISTSTGPGVVSS